MCGISGALVLDGAGEPITESLLAALNAPIGHRGPDGAGLWLAPDRRVGFAHRRLAIVDLSPAGAQPMSVYDRSWNRAKSQINMLSSPLMASLIRSVWERRKLRFFSNP